MSDATINFRAAEAAIEDLLFALPEWPDPAVTDLHIQGGRATVRRGGAVRLVELLAADLDGIVADIAALTASALRREISARSPRLEQRVPPRYRITCSHPSILQDGHWAMALRLLPTETIPLWRWVEDGYLSRDDHDRLVGLVGAPTTILVAGTMGSGKTTMLRSMLAEMPADQRLVVIEDAAELSLDRPNTVSYQTSHASDLTALLTHGFRTDAERVILGEVRDHAAMQFLTLASGGTRTITTVHCEPGVGALVRLHQLVMQSRFHITMEQITQAIHAIVTITRAANGKRSVELWERER